MNREKADWYRKWTVAVEKYCNFIIVLLLCIPTLFLIYNIAEFGVINYLHDQDAWDNKVRLVYPNSGKLSDGSQLTIAEYIIYVLVIILFSTLAFLFWTFVFTYLNMKLHHESFNNIKQNE